MKTTVRQAIQIGINAKNSGDVEQAERIFRAVLEHKPSNPHVNYQLGLIFSEKNRPDLAIPFLKTALAEDSQQETFWLGYIDALILGKRHVAAINSIEEARRMGIWGEKFEGLSGILESAVRAESDHSYSSEEHAQIISLRESGKFSEAEESLSQYLDAHPKDPEAWSLLSQILLLNKKVKESEISLRKALDLKSLLPSALRNHARLLLTKNKPAEALEQAQASYHISTFDPDSAFVLAVCLRANGRGQDALASIEEALEIRPDYAEALANRALIKYEMKDIEESIRDAKAAVSIKPHLTEVWGWLGSLEYQKKNYAGATEAFKTASVRDPENTNYLVNLGEVLRLDGKLEEAIQLLTCATEKNPNDSRLWTTYGTALQQSNNIEEAKKSFANALVIDPNSSESLNNLGAIAKKDGDWNRALGYFQKVVEMKPALAEGHNNLGITLRRLQRLEEAEDSLTTAIQLNPRYAGAHYNLGIVQKSLGKYEYASASYKKAIELRPDFEDAHTNLGTLYEEQGKPAEAVASFQRAFAERSTVRIAEKDGLAPATSHVFFEITNKCNFHCDFCPSDSQEREIGFMDISLVKSLYNEAAEKKIVPTVSLHLMGEPTLHPALTEILRFGASKNIKTDLVTNGSTLVSKMVPRILDELYGTLVASHMTPTEESYKFRGKVGLTWRRYIENLRCMVRTYMERLARGNVLSNNIVIRVMSTQNTAANVIVAESTNEARSILKEWADYVSELERELELTPFDRPDYTSIDILQNNDYPTVSYELQQGITLTFWRAFTFANTRVGDNFELEDLEKGAYCANPFTNVAVLWNGDVTLCCLDHDGELSVGNIENSDIETVIQSKPARALRASMLGRGSLPAICQRCQARPIHKGEIS